MKRFISAVFLSALFLAGCTLPPGGGNAVNVLFDGTVVPGPEVFEGRMRGVNIGLDYLIPENYNGWDGDCPGAVHDARLNEAKMAENGVVSLTLLNEQATAPNIMAAIIAVGKSLPDNGFLFVNFSGHGTQVPDKNGDEPDGLDEALCAADALLLDDVVAAGLAQLPESLNVVMDVDACTSGSSFRGRAMARSLHRSFKALDIKCNILYIGACEDGEVSWGSDDGGVSTNIKWKVHTRGMTYADWFTARYEAMPDDQKPVMVEYGESFVDQIAFCPDCYLESDDEVGECEDCEDEPCDTCSD